MTIDSHKGSFRIFLFYLWKNFYDSAMCTRTRANMRTRLRRDCRAVYVYACARKRASERAADVHVQRRRKHKLPMLLYARTHARTNATHCPGPKTSSSVVFLPPPVMIRPRRHRIPPPQPPRTRFFQTFSNIVVVL